MKTIKEGKISKPLPPIWVGVKFTCSKCGGEFELEASDVCLIKSHERRPGGTVVIEPPICKTVDNGVGCNKINTVSFNTKPLQ